MRGFNFAVLTACCVLAFGTRLFSVLRYESVIHEFDPYFNYRTTKYLVEKGLYNFHNWFDEASWYPLGRIIGGTIYPGLMWSAAAVYKVMNFFALPIDVRNACVFLAPLFAAFTVIVTYLMTKEVSNSKAGLFAAAFISVVPGYISRSVAGSFDNECISIFALLNVYYLWIKAVKTGSMFWAALCALGYFYMAAAWGGYIFIINLIPLYVFAMLMVGRFSRRLYVAYTTFYVLGIFLSMQITFIGFQPIQSGEHKAAFGVFVILHAFMFFRWVRSLTTPERFTRFLKVAGTTAAALGVTAYAFLTAVGYITPWTGRFYNLLDPTYAKEHIPIIASVSEHQPTTWASFFFDLHLVAFLFVAGIYYVFREVREERAETAEKNDGLIFLVIYGVTSVYFAGVMVRLMLVFAPIACILAALAASSMLTKYMNLVKQQEMERKDAPQAAPKRVQKKKARHTSELGESWERAKPIVPYVVLTIAGLMLVFYARHCVWVTSEAYSSPSIVLAARNPDGSKKIFDDFREAYFWLQQNTAPDAKIMSWWDYGYQISAMANRTVIVDNNTWNNSHIATVGTAMSSREEDAYPIMRALDVDYVLVIFGGLTGYASDDINKFLWMVRIGGGVFPRIVEKDFLTAQGEFRVDSAAPEAFLQSLMYKLCYYRFGSIQTHPQAPSGFDNVRGVEIGNKNFELEYLDEAYTTEHWIVRIYKVKKPEEL